MIGIVPNERSKSVNTRDRRKKSTSRGIHHSAKPSFRGEKRYKLRSPEEIRHGKRTNACNSHQRYWDSPLVSLKCNGEYISHNIIKDSHKISEDVHSKSPYSRLSLNKKRMSPAKKEIVSESTEMYPYGHHVSTKNLHEKP